MPNRPTVVIAKTIKGYGFPARLVRDEMSRINRKVERRRTEGFPLTVWYSDFRRRSRKGPVLQAGRGFTGNEVFRERREALGGYVPTRPEKFHDSKRLASTSIGHSSKSSGREVSTTTGAVTLMASLLKDKSVGKYIVPIVPDESRTFGMDPLFKQYGIYAHTGQLYEPVDSDQLLYYGSQRRPDS